MMKKRVTTGGMAPVFFTCEANRMRLGLGGARLGNLFSPVSDTEASAVVNAAWADGSRSYDTAPHYAPRRLYQL